MTYFLFFYQQKGGLAKVSSSINLGGNSRGSGAGSKAENQGSLLKGSDKKKTLKGCILLSSVTHFYKVTRLLESDFFHIQAFQDFRSFNFCNFGFNAVYNSILSYSPYVLLCNLDLHGFWFCVFLCVSTLMTKSRNACMIVSKKWFLAWNHFEAN